MGVTLPKSRFFHRRIFSTLRCFFIRYSALSPNKSSWAFHSISMHFLNFGTPTSWDSPLTMFNCCREIYVPMLFSKPLGAISPLFDGCQVRASLLEMYRFDCPSAAESDGMWEPPILLCGPPKPYASCLTSLGLQVYNDISMVSGGQSIMYIYIYNYMGMGQYL